VSQGGGPSGPRILYIDDDAGLCRLVSRVLGRRGYTIETAQSGADGVARAKAEPFEAVLVDHYMPDQLGLTTLTQLKDGGVSAPVIYVTGSDEIQIAVSALKAGAADYVIKSASEDFPTLLANAIEQALTQVSLKRDKEAAEAALRSANERLEAVVQHQAALLREVNHRVANSLQLVASLVHLQANSIGDGAAREALRDTEARIGAIMQIHRRLYTSHDVEWVEMDEYLAGLVAELAESVAAAEQNHPILLNAEPVRLPTDKAVSLGVIVTELVTNALKYAYAPSTPGEVRVALHRDGERRVKLVVEDDGRGMPGDAKPLGTGLGRSVIAAMARSLDSRLVLEPVHQGVRAVLSFGV
jgi:two-component sensor histidine kinase/CheY-like chemotaxis protein